MKSAEIITNLGDQVNKEEASIEQYPHQGKSMIGLDRGSKIASGNSHFHYSFAFCHFILLARCAQATGIFPIHFT